MALPSKEELMNDLLYDGLAIVCAAIEETRKVYKNGWKEGDKIPITEVKRKMLEIILHFHDEISKDMGVPENFGWDEFRKIADGNYSDWNCRFALESAGAFSKSIIIRIDFIHGRKGLNDFIKATSGSGEEAA